MILSTIDAINKMNFPVSNETFENTEVTWSSFISGEISVIDGQDVILAFKEFIYLLQEGSLHPIFGESGLNDNIRRYYNDMLKYFVDDTQTDDNSHHLTQLPIFKSVYSNILPVGETYTQADIFIIANVFTVYYLSRQLAQSIGFISDNRNNRYRNEYSNTPINIQSSATANKVFLYPEDPLNQNERIYNRYYGLENVDNRNIHDSGKHIIYDFFDKLILKSDAKTKNVICFDLEENGKYKKEDIVNFCKLFNPNMRISHYFQNNGANLLSSIKNLVRKNIKNIHTKDSIIENIALKYIERIQEIKKDIYRRYVLLFYRALANNKKITCPQSKIQCVYGGDVYKSILGLNFFGNFFYDFNINYGNKTISNECFYTFNNVKRGQSLYIYILGYDITDWDISNIQVSFKINEIMYHIEFEGNVITSYGIRPILKPQSTNSNSYYTKPQTYTDSLQRGAAGQVISMESVYPKDNNIKFYTCRSNSLIAWYERNKVRMSFAQSVTEIKVKFCTSKSTLWGLFFVM